MLRLPGPRRAGWFWVQVLDPWGQRLQGRLLYPRVWLQDAHVCASPLPPPSVLFQGGPPSSWCGGERGGIGSAGNSRGGLVCSVGCLPPARLLAPEGHPLLGGPPQHEPGGWGARLLTCSGVPEEDPPVVYSQPLEDTPERVVSSQHACFWFVFKPVRAHWCVPQGTVPRLFFNLVSQNSDPEATPWWPMLLYR